MSVTPMVLDMAAHGKAARQSFRVTNPGTKPMPVETSTAILDLGANGEQNTKKTDDVFLIYPPQAIIPPGGSQVFRVQWIGEPVISKSHTYRINVSQVPVKLPKNTSGMQILLSFGVTVNVAPSQGNSAIQVVTAAPVKGKDGKRLASLTVKNPGNIHAYLNRSLVRLSGGGWSAQMKPSDIAQKIGLGIVQPGKERRFVLPIEVPGNVSQIQAVVEQKPGG